MSIFKFFVNKEKSIAETPTRTRPSPNHNSEPSHSPKPTAKQIWNTFAHDFEQRLKQINEHDVNDIGPESPSSIHSGPR